MAIKDKEITMTKRNIIILAVSFLLVCSFTAVHAQTTPKKDKLNVLDYYNLLGTEGPIDESYKPPAISKKDLKNGYLLLIQEGMLTEVLLFRKNDGSAILLVAFSHPKDPRSLTDLQAYEKNEQYPGAFLVRVTEKVLPRLSNRENLAIFNRKKPREVKIAKTIGVRYVPNASKKIVDVIGIDPEKTHVKLYELHLKTDKFVLVGKGLKGVRQME